MDALKPLAAFLGWISGVVAGITAVLFAFGFIATAANQRLMGLTWSIIGRDALWYPGLGAQVFMHWFLTSLVVLVVLVVLAEATRAGAARLAGARNAVIGGVGRLVVQTRHWILATLVLACTLAIHWTLDEFLKVKDLLFLPFGDLCDAAEVPGALAGGNPRELTSAAAQVALFSAIAIGIVAYVLPAIIENRVPTIPTIVLAVAGVQALVAIPLSHGILSMDPALRSVAVRGPGEHFLEARPRYLVAGAPNGLWVWDPETRYIHWIAQSSFEQMQVGRARLIFVIACSDYLK